MRNYNYLIESSRDDERRRERFRAQLLKFWALYFFKALALFGLGFVMGALVCAMRHSA